MKDPPSHGREPAGMTHAAPPGADTPEGAAGQARPSPGEEAPSQPLRRTQPKHSSRRRMPAGPLPRFLLKLALLAAIFLLVFTFVLGMHINHGNRMYPFIMDGDLVVTYKLERYRVGDPVAYRNPETGKVSLSRIAAAGPCEINITDIGELLLDGRIPAENVFYPTKQLEQSTLAFPYFVEPGAFFLLDDYRTMGDDSRAFGALGEEDLLGRVVYVFRRRGI